MLLEIINIISDMTFLRMRIHNYISLADDMHQSIVSNMTQDMIILTILILLNMWLVYAVVFP